MNYNQHKQKTWRSSINYLLAGLFICALHRESLAGPSDGAFTNAITTEAFLLNPPYITKAVFEKEDLNVKANLPQALLKHRYLVKCDNTNYAFLMLDGKDGTPGFGWGKFDNTTWQNSGGGLNFAGPDDSGPQAGATWFDVNLIANLGFPALNKTNRVWDGSHHRILSTLEHGSPAVVQLTYDHGVISSAVLSNTVAGQNFALVEYRYDTNFYNGQFPVEFTRSFINPEGTAFVPTCVVRFYTLELTNQPLPPADLDPRELYRAGN